jgi:predicted ATPase
MMNDESGSPSARPDASQEVQHSSFTIHHSQQAESCFQRAIEIAREQSAKSLELRAAMSLGRVWNARGTRREARELIEPIYDWFSEGFDTPDLRDAKALLDGLV